MDKTIKVETLNYFAAWLKNKENHPATIEKYLRDMTALMHHLAGRPVSRETLSAWKADLLGKGYAPVTINSMLSAVHQFLKCVGWENCRVKYLRIQRRAFRENSRELTHADYHNLLATAQQRGQTRLALLLETLAATGVRVSEVRYITVDAAQCGCAEISLKGKIRRILLPAKLCRKLLKYAKKQKIASGEIFLTKSGKGWGRKQIWAALKTLASHAGVAADKVFPHNFRHLFAVSFFKVCRDIAKLADVLGHSNIETTRIYLTTSGEEHRRTLEQLGFVT